MRDILVRLADALTGGRIDRKLDLIIGRLTMTQETIDALTATVRQGTSELQAFATAADGRLTNIEADVRRLSAAGADTTELEASVQEFRESLGAVTALGARLAEVDEQTPDLPSEPPADPSGDSQPTT